MVYTTIYIYIYIWYIYNIINYTCIYNYIYIYTHAEYNINIILLAATLLHLPSCKLTQTLPKWGGMEYEFRLKIGDAHRLSGSMLYTWEEGKLWRSNMAGKSQLNGHLNGTSMNIYENNIK